jgi:hypothetical protein
MGKKHKDKSSLSKKKKAERQKVRLDLSYTQGHELKDSSLTGSRTPISRALPKYDKRKS